MKKINDAYSILSNEQKRKSYDIELANKRMLENKKNVIENINTRILYA